MSERLTITVPEVQDKELQVIAICTKSLETLDALAARRVLDYIQSKVIDKQYATPLAERAAADAKLEE